MENIIIFGAMGAGKSTLAGIIQKICAEQEYNSSIFSLGEDIKKITKEHNYNDTDKRFCNQQIGQEFRRIFGQDIWCFRTYSKMIKQMEDTGSQIFIIDDGRQDNELAYWKHKRFKTVGIFSNEYNRYQRLLKRDGVDQRQHFEFINEKTAAAIAYFECDITIENNGTLEELELQARALFRR